MGHRAIQVLDGGSATNLGDELQAVVDELDREAFEIVRDQLMLAAKQGHERIPWLALDVPRTREAGVLELLRAEGVEVAGKWRGRYVSLRRLAEPRGGGDGR